MNKHSLTHLADRTILANLDRLDRQDWDTTAELLANLAVVDERKLYAPLGYPSLLDYCVLGRHYTEDVAKKRIRAARIASRVPAVFAALAEGWVDLSGIAVLAKHLTPENAEELLAAATHKTRAEIERLVAERFPTSELLSLEPSYPAEPSRGMEQSLPPVPPEGTADSGAPGHLDGNGSSGAPGHLAPHHYVRITPLSKDSFGFQASLPGRIVEKIRYAQKLASHKLPNDLMVHLEAWLDVYLQHQEKKRFGANSRLRSGRRGCVAGRYIPVSERHKVWERDQGQCTFVSAAGRRCPARTRLEHDHIVPFARGGQSTAENIRLRCRAHNQLEAERAFGACFVEHKRQEARAQRARNWVAAGPMNGKGNSVAVGPVSGNADSGAPGHLTKNGVRGGATKSARNPVPVAKQPRVEAEASDDKDVVPWLRALGYRAAEAQRAAEACQSTPDASLEDRIRFALRFLMPAHRRSKPPCPAR